jgi:hypothetical protein
MPPLAREVLDERGTELAQRIGLDVIRQVVLDVLCGRNLRDSTEMLTRRRIATLNAATLVMLVRGAHRGRDFIRCLPDAVVDELKQRPRKHQRWILQWALGLTEKAAQNVLRDDFGALDEYKERYVAVLKDVISACERDFGPLVGEIRLSSQERAAVHWEFILHLLTTVGAQTLAIRGSEKSLYGKLFERLVLGSVLHALGFDLVPAPPNLPRLDRVFWLASPAEKRESDATALLGAGKGVRFDIGFIGRGNPEITLDKVTRYEREIDLGRRTWYLATFIIVDRIGARSGIQDLARRVDGTVVQMSMSYWPQELARQLRSKVGYAGELVDLEPTRLREYLAQKLALAPLQSFLEPPPAGRRRERAAPEGGDA